MGWDAKHGANFLCSVDTYVHKHNHNINLFFFKSVQAFQKGSLVCTHDRPLCAGLYLNF